MLDYRYPVLLYLLLVGDGLEGVLLEAEVAAQQQRAQSYELLVRLLAPAPATRTQLDLQLINFDNNIMCINIHNIRYNSQ